MYDIREPRYEEFKMGYQILDIRYIGQSCLEIWCLTLISSLLLYRNGFELELFLNISPLKWGVTQPLKMFIAREIIHKLRWYQISRYSISITSNMIPHIWFCLYLGSLISYRNVFVLQTEQWIPPFKCDMSQPLAYLFPEKLFRGSV